MTEEYSAQWHDEPTDYGQIGKLPRFEAASANDEKASLVSSSLNITAAAADPELLDLPWHIALEDWPAENLAALPRGISRHIVRFAHLGGSVIAITTAGDSRMSAVLDDTHDVILAMPRTTALLTPVIVTVPLQLLAYYIAVRRGCDVDQPRNLAKSVTVE